MTVMTDIDIVQVSSSSVDADGFVGISCDWVGDDNAGGVQQAEAHHPLGFVAIPMDPTVGASPDGGVTPGQIDQACNVLRMWESDRCHTIALNDPRAMANLPNWNKGDAAMYAPSGYGNFVRVRQDGRVEISTRTAAEGADVYSLLMPNDSAQGAPACFADVAPWGTQRFDRTGWHLSTQWGACADFGGFSDGGAMAAAGLSSTIRFRSSQFTAAAAIVKLGSGSGHTPVAMAVPLAATLTTLVGQLSTLNSALVTFAGALASDPYASAAAASLEATCGLLGELIASLATSLSGAATPLTFASTTTSAL